MIPGVFENTLLTGRTFLRPSLFMRPMHPKTEIRPTSEAIHKILHAGWVGQLKIHGHRAQIHIPSKADEAILIYNRQGQIHKKSLPLPMDQELRRVFAPASQARLQWNVIDAEWLKQEDRIYVFDFLKREDESLHRFNFVERWKTLPRAYLSPHLQTLGLITTLETCLEALKSQEKHIEGLVFKSPSPGFEDSSIIRCRK